MVNSPLILWSIFCILANCCVILATALYKQKETPNQILEDDAKGEKFLVAPKLGSIS